MGHACSEDSAKGKPEQGSEASSFPNVNVVTLDRCRKLAFQPLCFTSKETEAQSVGATHVMIVENAGGTGRISSKTGSLTAPAGSHARNDQHLLINTKSHLSHFQEGLEFIP